MTYTATYSPEDNKLRLYASSRLDKETYDRVKAAGFRWAPKQDLFVAPMWTPSREDLLLELAGEIDDEDKTLVERQEERAERFEGYHESRTADAEAARKAVHAIADHIPLGQPILVGHHSERHARKDAERIENGMRKAVRMWETAQYWKDRAAGAIAHAKYKELPGVRARRIKTIEAEIRAMKAKYTPQSDRQVMQERWNESNGVKIPHVFCGSANWRGGTWVPVEDLPKLEAYYSRWIAHCERRLEYERAMLAESGGLAVDRFNIEVGGKVLTHHSEWVTVLRVNRKDGAITSVTTSAKYVPVVSIEKVRDYKAPSAEEAAKVQQAITKGPLCNYPGPRFATMTQAEWDAAHKDSRGYRSIEPHEGVARHRVPICIGFRCHLPAKEGHELEPGYCDANRTHKYWPVFITDAKRKDPPQSDEEPLKLVNERVVTERPSEKPPSNEEAKQEVDAMRESLRAGVKVVSAPQLFPTPPDVVRKMIAQAGGVLAGRSVLEPSAGTGNIVRAIISHCGADCVRVTAVELNHALVEGLETIRKKTLYANESNFRIVQGDFLECNGDLGKFDVVLMNPPFENGADIKHIKHALTFLKPGGRLVAICANGPRQQEQLHRSMVVASGGNWEELPEGTFPGTGVRTAMVTLTAASAPRTTLFD